MEGVGIYVIKSWMDSWFDSHTKWTKVDLSMIQDEPKLKI